MNIKKFYERPVVDMHQLAGIALLSGSETTLPTDPTDGTDEALSKDDGGYWED